MRLSSAATVPSLAGLLLGSFAFSPPSAAAEEGNTTETTTTAAPPVEDAPQGTEKPCNCDGCPSSDSVILGGHTELVSPECDEGYVATVTTLRTIADKGDYELLTWNTGGSTYTDEILGSPYKYSEGTAGEGDEVTCFEADEEDLPVIGDQRKIEVLLNCESFSGSCSFRYDVQFGCAETGVLTSVEGGGVQVLSDVDDTIVCPFPQCDGDEVSDCSPSEVKHFLAGVDKRLEDGEFYPGVAELMLGLALGPGADDRGKDEYLVPPKPLLLSARPVEAQAFLGISQGDDLNLYAERVGVRGGHSSWGINVDSSLYGTIFDTTDFTEFGQTKARHYNEVSAASPGTRFAFLGDNGQGDVCAAQSMLDSGNGDRMAAVLIHVTQTNEDRILKTCEAPDGTEFTLDLAEGSYDGRVHYHSTESDAASWALDRGLISCCSASAVHNAVSEWVACRCGGSIMAACAYNATVPLPTGPFVTATGRAETDDYCVQVAMSQLALKSKVNLCDPGALCPIPVPGAALLDDSLAPAPARAVAAGAVVAVTAAMLVM